MLRILLELDIIIVVVKIHELLVVERVMVQIFMQSHSLRGYHCL